MLKSIGALCILIGSSAFGEYKARSFHRRVRDLQQFQRSLKLLATEIRYARSMLPYAFKSVGGQLDSPVGELYLRAAELLLQERTPREAWREALAEIWPRAHFSRADGEIIEALGSALGVEEKEGQLKQIQLTLQYLEFALEEARESNRRQAKMWRYLGYLTGAALVIFFL